MSTKKKIMLLVAAVVVIGASLLVLQMRDGKDHIVVGVSYVKTTTDSYFYGHKQYPEDLMDIRFQRDYVEGHGLTVRKVEDKTNTYCMVWKRSPNTPVYFEYKYNGPKEPPDITRLFENVPAKNNLKEIRGQPLINQTSAPA